MKPATAPPLDANLVWLGSVDSTNDVAARLVAAWAEDEDERLDDTVIVAGVQTAGRGRGDHAWASPPGGLYATWLGWLPAGELRWLPIAAGVCLAGAADELLGGEAVQLKWPNDVVAGGRKLGGVLCQSRSRGEMAWAAVGFGLNVAVEPELEGDRPLAATSLAALGFRGDPEQAIRAVAAAVTRCLRPALGRASALPEEWARRTVHRVGDELRIKANGEVIVGSYVGLAADGQLELEVGGARRLVPAGGLIGELPQAEE